MGGRIILAALAIWLLGIGAAAARVDRMDAFPSQHVDPRRVEVWVPNDYETSGKRYAVLYMHDGQNLFSLADSNFNKIWAVPKHIERLTAQGRIRDVIVVGVWSTPKRWREYAPAGVVERLPTALQEKARALAGGPVLSDAYVDFLVQELKPAIDARYRTLPARDDTFIMGSSMGGLISLHALTRHPDVFAGAGCLSTHWPLAVPARDGWDEAASRDAVIAAERAYLEASPLDPERHRLYFDYGTATLDALYEPYQTALDPVIEGLGFTREANWTTRKFPGAEHEENAWNARLDEPLLFLLGRE